LGREIARKQAGKPKKIRRGVSRFFSTEERVHLTKRGTTNKIGRRGFKTMPKIFQKWNLSFKQERKRSLKKKRGNWEIGCHRFRQRGLKWGNVGGKGTANVRPSYCRQKKTGKTLYFVKKKQTGLRKGGPKKGAAAPIGTGWSCHRDRRSLSRE